LPTRSQTSVSTLTSPPPVKGKPAPPPKLVSQTASPGLPPRRESITVPGPSQDAAPSPPRRESSYGQLRKTFGSAMDSTQVNDLRNSLRKTPSSSTNSPVSVTSPPPKVSMQDARTASGIAQKYQKDPSSLSLADAKAGLNVANKILPQSSDKSPPNRQDLQTAANLGQKWNKDPNSLGFSDLKAGYSVANKFRPQPTQTPSESSAVTSQTRSPPEKYGVNDLKSRFANVTLGGLKPPPAPRPVPSPQPQSPIAQNPSQPPATKKKPPPPPPKPRFSNGTSTPPQPSYNISTKPTRSTPTATSRRPPSWTPKDIPLDFDKKWYCSDPMQQIPYLAANSTKAISGSSVSASGSGYAGRMTWTYTAVFAIRWTTDLSRTFIRVTWNSDDPVRSVQGRQKHFPPPTPLGGPDLENAARLYGSGIVRFCEVNMGRQVGNGECWTLAHDALQQVQNTVSPRVMVSNGTVHGQCIYQREAATTVFGDLEMLRPGDIVQYLECKFERRQNGRLVQSSAAGAPDHTSYLS